MIHGEGRARGLTIDAPESESAGVMVVGKGDADDKRRWQVLLPIPTIR